jgi:hypothetical protein
MENRKRGMDNKERLTLRPFHHFAVVLHTYMNIPVIWRQSTSRRRERSANTKVSPKKNFLKGCRVPRVGMKSPESGERDEWEALRLRAGKVYRPGGERGWEGMQNVPQSLRIKQPASGTLVGSFRGALQDRDAYDEIRMKGASVRGRQSRVQEGREGWAMGETEGTTRDEEHAHPCVE